MLVIYPAFLEFKEIMIILFVVVIFFGPNKIPEIARGLGTAVRKMKEATDDIKQEILNPAADLDPTKEIRETISNLDPTKQVQDAFKGADPTADIAKALEDPITSFEKTIFEDNNETASTTADTVENIKETVELAKSEIEIQTEQELGNGGSISR